MSRDYLKEDSQKTTRDVLMKTGGAALALGAGAALFHRAGGSRYLSQGIGAARALSSNVKRDLAEEALKSGPKDNIFKTASDSIRRSINDGTLMDSFNDQAIRIRKNTEFRGFFESMQEYSRLSSSSTGDLRRLYNKEKVMPEILGRFGSNQEIERIKAIERFSDSYINAMSSNMEGAKTFKETVKASELLRSLTNEGKYKVEDAMEILDFVHERMERSNQMSGDHLRELYDPIIRGAKNKLADANSIGKRFGKKTQDSFVEKILGDRPATIEEVLASVREGRISRKDLRLPGDDEFEETLQRMLSENPIEKQQDFLDTFFDRSIRMRDGEIYSVGNAADAIESFGKGFSDTIVGKIFRTGSILDGRKSPLLTRAFPGDGDPLLASMVQKTKDHKALALNDSFMRIYDKTYKVTERGMEYIEGSDQYKLIKQGTRQRLIGTMLGDVEMKDPSSNPLFRVLDINQAGSPTIFGKIKSAFTKFEDDSWIRTARKNIIEGKYYEDFKKGIDAVKSIDYNFSQKSRAMDERTRRMILEQISDGESSVREVLNIAQKNNEEMMEQLAALQRSSGGEFRNADLNSLFNKFKRSPQEAYRTISKKKASGYTEVLDFHDLIRREVDKEAFIRGSRGDTNAKKTMLNLIDSADISQREAQGAKELMHWGMFQEMTNPKHNMLAESSPEKFVETIDKVRDLLSPIGKDGGAGPDVVRDFQNVFNRVVDETSNITESRIGSHAELFQPNRYNQHIHIKKTINPLDIIKDLNDTEKMKAFGKQFIAGRNDPENITEATTVPYFFLNRMSDAMNHIGAGFSARSIGSTPEFVKNIALKRILPIYGAMTYGSYLNDMTREITGMSFTGALASTASNIDIGARRIADLTGIGSLYQTEKEINPILQYWGGGKEYQTAEEREEWYDSGYSAVRRSRWWNFGSLNEFRGSDIEYFQPNYLRRSHSNWRDESLYDSTWEKWGRHPLPTPTAPWSTLRYLNNPYWLEEKHSESRPYPMTGKLFSEETPWGAILNPTLGEFIKPQQRMHDNRLGRSMVDVKMIIEERNRAEFDKARRGSDSSVIRIKDGMVENVSTTSMYHPTPSQRLLTITPQGELLGANLSSEQDRAYGIRSSGGSGIASSAQTAGTAGALPQINSVTGETELNFQSRMEIRAIQGEVLPGIISEMISPVQIRRSSLDQIRQHNESIKYRGAINKQQNVITPESIFRSEARYSQDILHNKEALADLRNINRASEGMTDILYSARYISGIYGYLGHVLTPNHVEYRLANANRMTSASGQFWDQSVGGLGGGPQEILRRFMPHSNRFVEHVNPLMNDMPDWIPLRFRTGDPFTEISKGGMRLPGDGYESIHDLHPDQYGEYGAFDRMKILADVAPYSDEYRLWRDIASKTVDDPDLRSEMQEIRQRVNEQSQSNDFYNYGFLGRGLEQQTAVVDQVLDNNHFTIIGSSETYRMAGISVSPGEDGENVLEHYLRPGSQVVLRTDKNEYHKRNEDYQGSINAAVHIDGMNINRELLNRDLASRREADTSAAATMGMHSDFQIARGKMYEAIAHMPIPIIQDKYMRIRTPLESYQREQIYNTPFASWRNPIDSYLKPAMERSVSSPMNVAIGTLAIGAARQLEEHQAISATAQKWVNRGAALSNPGAMIGSVLGFGAKLQSTDWVRKGGNIGAAAMVAGFAYTRREDPLYATASGAGLGAMAMKAFNHGQRTGKGALVGGLIGLAISSQGKSLLSSEDRKNFLTGTYIPERIKDVWETEEYYDRLKYQKYQTLYEKAARRARIFEGTDIKSILNRYDMDQAQKEEQRQELLAQKNAVINSPGASSERKQRLVYQIDQALESLDEQGSIYLEGGKYTRSAILYKGAMDSTIYGLKEDAGWTEILRALPRNDRDYFLEFAKETDPKKREEILRYISPYSRRALQIAWGEEPDRVESNRSYFRRHNMPGPTWSGWRPDVDIDNIMVKNIYNEGMMLADFGKFDSQLREPGTINAEYHEMSGPNTPFNIRNSIMTALNNAGINTASVNVTPQKEGRIEMLVNNIRIEQYNFREKLPEFLSRRM